MGYFANGSEGDGYYEEWCERCAHNPDCAVWLAHHGFNYKDCNNPESILHILIPRTKNGNNEKCRMFIEKPHE